MITTMTITTIAAAAAMTGANHAGRSFFDDVNALEPTWFGGRRRTGSASCCW